MTGGAPIRVVIADDVAEFRSLLRIKLVLDGRFEAVGEASDGSEAVAVCAAQRPDVLLLDLSMPEMDGLQAIAAVREASPETKIVVLSGFTAVRMHEDVLARGAHAYVEKGTEADRITGLLVALCPRDVAVAAAQARPDVAAVRRGAVEGRPRTAGTPGDPRLQALAVRTLVEALEEGLDRMPRSALEDVVANLGRATRDLCATIEADGLPVAGIGARA